MVSDWPILSLLIWLPLVGGLIVLVVGDRYGAWHAAVLVALLDLLLGVAVLSAYDAAAGTVQLLESGPWIDAFGIRADYALGVDGVSVALLLLNVFMTLLVVLASRDWVAQRVAQYFAALLFLSGVVNGVFMAQDLLLFFVLFEAMLIPLFLLMGVWGGAQRVYATFKYFLYTFFASVFLLVSVAYVYTQVGSFSLGRLYDFNAQGQAGSLLFLAMLFAFGVKVPLWPLHTWSPDAYEQAPVGVSVMLAAISVKVGAYGLYRVVLPVLPDQALDWALLVVLVSLVAIVYMGLVALVQTDLKRFLAYSSAAHMGFVTLGLFLVFKLKGQGFSDNGSTGSIMAVQGSMVQMVSHGLVVGALFLCVGMLMGRMQTARIGAFGGVANRMPVFAAFFVLFALANVGMPGTSGFVGELLVILASAKAHVWVAMLAATTLIISAAYTLWVVKRIVFGEVASAEVDQLVDLRPIEWLVLGLLAVPVIWIGVWPEHLTHLMEASIRAWVGMVAPSSSLSAVGSGS